MSRIGKRPIPVPAGVTIAIDPDRVTVNGPKGELTERIPRYHRGQKPEDGDGGDQPW
jgi:ribosomal protein L6P/L9E